MDSTELLTKHYVGNGIKEDEMGRAYGTNGEKRNSIQNFGGET
jgi:hypothetical protein